MGRQVTIAAVQPKTFRGTDEVKNVDHALEYIDEAADAGAQIVSFPEGYPGPYYGGLSYDADERLCERACARSVYVVCSRLEHAEGDRYILTLRLIDPAGEVIGVYERVQVPSSSVNRGLFGKDLVAGSVENLKVYETEVGNIGLLICSEVYSPELARVLALRGADMLFYPVGGLIYEQMETWQTMIWARAIENHVYVASTQNIYGRESGVGMIAGPEEILAKSAKAGILFATLDLDRLRELREGQEVLAMPNPYATVPGLLRWRRPELYAELIRAQAATAPERTATPL